ncbi:MAG: HAD hydrolase family protein [Syntrophales bacterium]
MLEIEIPGFGHVALEYMVSDYTGTLSVAGRLLPEVKKQLNKIAAFLKVHIVTADTFGMVQSELKDVNCIIRIFSGDDHDLQKEDYIRRLGVEHVVAFGNGKNDRRMLKAAKIGIAVSEAEGCAVDALMAADIHVRSALDGLNLLLHPKKCKATLRF